MRIKVPIGGTLEAQRPRPQLLAAIGYSWGPGAWINLMPLVILGNHSPFT
ncbi:MAG: hypothetical protein ACXADU_13880 [Promethearchaeota archaeon]